MSRFAQAMEDHSPRLRTLFFDIETAPSLAYIWQAKTEYVQHGAIQHETFMLTWAAKWGDSDEVFGKKLTKKEALAQDDSRIVAALADMIREADVVVAHNGDRFDVPMLNNRLMLMGLEPLGPVNSIDTLKLARKSFRLMSNRLDWIAKQLGCGGKLHTSFSLWERCYHGEPAAFRQMLEYNKKDVVLLQEVYERILPYVKGGVRTAEAEFNGQMACPSCGGRELERDGFHRTSASTYDKFKCADCGRHCRTRSARGSRKLAVVPL